MMFYHIVLSIPLCVYNFRLFSFHYYVTTFVFYQKTECKSIYYHFRHGHESSSFRKLARNKWICREICDFFSILKPIRVFNFSSYFDKLGMLCLSKLIKVLRLVFSSWLVFVTRDCLYLSNLFVIISFWFGVHFQFLWFFMPLLLIFQFINFSSELLFCCWLQLFTESCLIVS